MFRKNQPEQPSEDLKYGELTDLQLALRKPEFSRNFEAVRRMFESAGVNLVEAFDEVVERSPDDNIVVLDVGCGTGSSIEHFSRIMGERENLRGRVLNTIGLDKNPLPHLIPEEIHQRKEIRTQFLPADAHKIPLPDNSVHFGYSVALMRYCKDPLRVLEEGHRVLKPGGIMLWLLGGLTDISTFPHQDTIFKNTPGGKSFQEYFGEDDDHSTLACSKDPNHKFEGFPYSLMFNFPRLFNLFDIDKFRVHKIYRKTTP